jgi:hypothetical protein
MAESAAAADEDWNEDDALRDFASGADTTSAVSTASPAEADADADAMSAHALAADDVPPEAPPIRFADALPEAPPAQFADAPVEDVDVAHPPHPEWDAAPALTLAPDVDDREPVLAAHVPAPPDVFDRPGRSRSHGAWAGAIVLFTVLALAGGWYLLRWGTPSPTTAGVDASSPPPDAEPGAATAPSPGVQPRSPANGSAPPAARPPDSRPAPPPDARAPAPPAASSPRSAPPAATAPEPPRARPTPPAPTTTAAAQAPRPQPAAPSEATRPQPPATTPPLPPTPAPSARLLVRSTPAGAEVFVNGVRRGVTPLALRDLPFGTHTVRVARPGFAPSEQRVSLEQGRPARAIDVPLTRSAAGASAAPSGAAPTGILVIDSRPSGARVIVDGAEAGVTPLTLPSVAAGVRQVRLELTGYLPISATVTVEAGERARLGVSLTPEGH